MASLLHEAQEYEPQTLNFASSSGDVVPFSFE